MSLRSDAVYRVDLRTSSQEDERAGSPPKVVQIRLTEQAFQQLANACSSSQGGSIAGIRIDVDPAEPVLVIGDTQFALHAPLLASSGQAGKSHAPSDAGSSSTAPHELYRLSADESTLHRIGTISTKLSVKPTRDVSAVAQRLKQQKEEEEHRKEERRKALMQGATPHPIASSSARTGINKTLTNGRGLSSSPSLVTSSLRRSSSLNRLPSRREPELLPSSLSRGLSREPSPGSRSSSSTALHAKSQLAPHDDSVGARRADRAYTDSPKVSATTPSPSSRRLLDQDHKTKEPGSSRVGTKRFNLDRPDEDDQREPKSQPSSPASGASDVAKKTSKLTTRQRLAKATKAGSRLLAASERRATPERRTAPIGSQASPPSKLAAPVPQAVAESAKAASSSTSFSNVTSTAKQTGAGASTEQAARSAHTAGHASTDLERGQRLSSVSTTSSTVRDNSSTAQQGQAKSRTTQTRAAADRETREKRAGLQASSAVKPDPDSAGIAKRRDTAVTDDHTIPRISKSVVEHDERKPRTAEKEARPAPSQVADVKTAANATRSDSTDSHPSSQSSKKPDARSFDREGSRRGDAHKRTDSLSERDARSTTSISSAKHASTRPPEDDRLDPVPRKRRRTNDFAASDSTRDHGRRISTSPGPSTPRTDDSFARRGESSRDESIRRSEPRSPRTDRESRGISVSASMPSLASVSTRLQPVSESSDRDARRSRTEEYHDRRRDPSYDEAHDEYTPQDRDRSSHRDKDDALRGRSSGDAGRTSSRGLPPTSDSAEAERPMRGVGPGATHWSEPWLDVRSKADWHRLAQRFRKTQDEYLLSRKRLEAENERLQWELELASVEEQSESQPAFPAEQSLLFSPHNVSATPEGGHDTGDVEMATAINTAINSRTRSRPAGGDGDESPEEGEMRSSDDEDGHVTAKLERVSASPVEPVLQAARRSESPENLAWRSGGAKTQSTDRPLSYADLAERVQQLEEMHGSLSRMHRVLVEFKARSVAATG